MLRMFRAIGLFAAAALGVAASPASAAGDLLVAPTRVILDGSRGTEVVLGAHDGWLLTCSILTRASDGPMRGIHDRVPVILETDDVDAWLDPRQTDAAAAMAVAARETPDLRWYEVSRSVNTPRNNSPDPLEPVPDGETGHS